MKTTNSNPLLLEINRLTMRFGGVVAISEVSLRANMGEITAIIGPNGAGKTTLFNCITGFYRPSEGEVLLHEADGPGSKTRNLASMPGFRISKVGKVARTFQNIRLFSGMTVLENLLVAQHNELMRASGYTVLAVFGLGNYRTAEKKAIERARFWMEETGLTDFADERASDLPYGKQRLLEIARAMCTQPRLLCLDEPAAGLNPRETAELTHLINDIRQLHSCGVLLIEHDMGMVMRISDHVVVLDYGKKITDGAPEQVRAHPDVIRAYLGSGDDAAA